MKLPKFVSKYFFKYSKQNCICYSSDQYMIPIWSAIRSYSWPSLAELDRTHMTLTICWYWGWLESHCDLYLLYKVGTALYKSSQCLWSGTCTFRLSCWKISNTIFIMLYTTLMKQNKIQSHRLNTIIKYGVLGWV